MFRIKSDNPNLMDVLNKNPNTDFGLYLKSLRNGQLIGNVVDSNNYEVLFQDTKNSFTKYEDNQIDFKSFCCPEVPLSIIRELFNHLIVEKEKYNTKISWLDKTIDKVDTMPCEIIIDDFFIKSNWYRENEFLLTKYFPKVTVKPKEFGVFQLKVKADTVFDAINLLALVSFFTKLTNDGFDLDDGLVGKYVKVLSNIDSPYFIYYLFIKRCLAGKTFDKYAPLLEESFKKLTGVDVVFTPNNTQVDRMKFVERNINVKNKLLDYGCCEFQYFKFLSKRTNVSYYGYDIDDYTELYDKWSKGRFLDKDWHFSTTLPEIEEPITVICSEVIEHMEDPTDLKELFIKYDVQEMVVTTPNIEFNKYYAIDGLRREDHLREYTYEQFKALIKSIIPKGYEITFHNIGDLVGEVSPTLAAKIIKK